MNDKDKPVPRWRRAWRAIWRPSARWSVGALLVVGIIGGVLLWGGFHTAMDATNTRRFNPAFTSISTNGTSTVEASTRALTTENNELDPRSTTIKLNTRPADGINTIYIPAKYNAATLSAGQAIPLPIARYAEAQLILAEAQGGTAGVTIINNMRAAVGLAKRTQLKQRMGLVRPYSAAELELPADIEAALTECFRPDFHLLRSLVGDQLDLYGLA